MLDFKGFIKKTKGVKQKYFIFFLLVVLLIGITAIRNNPNRANSEEISNGKNNSNEIEVKDIIETINLDPNNAGKVIVIDPGHGSEYDMSKEPLAPGSNKKRVKAPTGATGEFTNIPEYQVNWEVSLKLKKLLEEKGFVVVFTKTDIKKNPTGIERAEIGNKTNARLVVRIHADSFEDASVWGTSLLAPEASSADRKKLSEESSRCANIIMEYLVDQAGVKNRGVKLRSDLTAFNWSNVPTLLIEMGFLSNKKEDTLLVTDEYQNKLATAIASGIEEAVKIEWNK